MYDHIWPYIGHISSKAKKGQAPCNIKTSWQTNLLTTKQTQTHCHFWMFEKTQRAWHIPKAIWVLF